MLGRRTWRGLPLCPGGFEERKPSVPVGEVGPLAGSGWGGTGLGWGAGFEGAAEGDRRGRLPVRQQADARVAQQEQGIQVGRPAAQAPMQAGLRAVGEGRLHGAQMVSRGDLVALPHGGGDGEVGGAQAARVVDRDHPSAGDGAGVTDGALTCGENRSGGRGGQVDASMAGQPGCRRWSEAAQDARGAVEGPAPDGALGPGRRNRHEEGEDDGDDGDLRNAGGRARGHDASLQKMREGAVRRIPFCG